MNIFQYKYIRKQVRASEKQELFVREGIPILSKAASICILCSYENDEQILDMLKTINQYQGQVKRIRLMVYVSQKKLPPILLKSLFIQPVLKKELGYFGQFSAEAKHNIQIQNYDIFINTISKTNTMIANYISSLIKADFKITRSLEHAKLYHLTLPLDEEQSLEYYLDTIEKYTAKLNGK